MTKGGIKMKKKEDGVKNEVQGKNGLDILDEIDVSKRDFIKRLVMTTAFAIPAIQSFSLAEAKRWCKPSPAYPTGSDGWGVPGDGR